jgi:hypothetical protein
MPAIRLASIAALAERLAPARWVESREKKREAKTADDRRVQTSLRALALWTAAIGVELIVGREAAIEARPEEWFGAISKALRLEGGFAEAVGRELAAEDAPWESTLADTRACAALAPWETNPLVSLRAAQRRREKEEYRRLAKIPAWGHEALDAHDAWKESSALLWADDDLPLSEACERLAPACQRWLRRREREQLERVVAERGEANANALGQKTAPSEMEAAGAAAARVARRL